MMWSGTVVMSDDFEIFRVDRSERGRRVPSSKIAVVDHLRAPLSSFKTVGEVFEKTSLPPGLACPEPWILRYFPTVAPFLVGKYTST